MPRPRRAPVLQAARAAIAAAAAVCALAPWRGASAEPVVYRLDPTHSFVHFELDHFGASTTRGRFGPVTGEVTLDRAARRGRVQVRIPTASVSLGFPAFDARVRRADLLAVDEHPEAFFVAEQVLFDGDAVREVRGEFTLRGTSRPLVLRALRFRCYLNPLWRREVCGGDFEGEAVRSEFGMDFALPVVGDRVRLLIQVEALRD